MFGVGVGGSYSIGELLLRPPLVDMLPRVPVGGTAPQLVGVWPVRGPRIRHFQVVVYKVAVWQWLRNA